MLGLVGLGIYAYWQKRRAERAIVMSRLFGNINMGNFISFLNFAYC